MLQRCQISIVGETNYVSHNMTLDDNLRTTLQLRATWYRMTRVPSTDIYEAGSMTILPEKRMDIKAKTAAFDLVNGTWKDSIS